MKKIQVQNAHYSNLSEIPGSNIEKLLGFFGLSDAEKQIIVRVSGRPETTITLARLVSKPRSTVQDMLKRLEQRHLVYKVKYFKCKNPHWKSDVRKTIIFLNRLVSPFETADFLLHF